MPRMNNGRDGGYMEMIELLREMNSNLERLGDGISVVQENIYRKDNPNLPSLPGKSKKEESWEVKKLNKASKAITDNRVVNFAGALLKLQKSISDAANTIGSLVTENFDMKQRYNVSQSAQAQTAGFASAIAAQGGQLSDAQIADTYLQFNEINKRQYDAQRRVKYLTSRGNPLTGIIPGAAQLGTTVEGWTQEAYNLLYRPESWLESDLRSIMKTQTQSKMQKDINANNKISDSGGY